MSPYILHGRGESGNSYKAALMLNLSKLDWEPRLVGFFTEETKLDFRSNVSEQGEVPVLEHEGKRLSQSGVILTYIADSKGVFGPQSADERLEILRWLLFDNHKFSSYYATLRFHLGFLKTGETPVTQFLRAQAIMALTIVEDHLEGRPYIVGHRPTIADISMVGYRYYDDETGIDWELFPRIKAWAKRVATLPGWAHPYDLLPRAAPLAAG
jgi:glutathione S-transferase